MKPRKVQPVHVAEDLAAYAERLKRERLELGTPPPPARREITSAETADVVEATWRSAGFKRPTIDAEQVLAEMRGRPR